jgi:alpha-mannosidase
MVIKGTELARIVPTIHGRMMGALTVNRLDIEEGRRTVVRLHLGAVAEGAFDVEAAKRRVEEIIAKRPNAKYHVVGEGPPLCRMLVEAPPTDGLGWTTLAPRGGSATPRDPVAVDGRTLRNAALEATVAGDGTVSLLHRESGLRLDGVLALEDDGDAGDEYNYSPPEKQSVVRTPDEVRIEHGATGPLEASFVIRRRYRVPIGLAANGRARHRRTVALDTTTTVALRSGEPFLRVRVDVENRADDHRLRLRVPLPAGVHASHAESAFCVVERGRDAESGSHEHALPTYPSRRFVDASNPTHGVAVLHAGTPEYELEGDALAITLLRCVGWLSRQGMAYRAGPAGPPLPAPGAQLPGAHSFELAVFPHAGDWRAAKVYDAAEAFGLPFRPVVARAHEGVLASSGAGLSIEPDAVQLSAMIRDGDAVDVRVFNASPEATNARLILGPTLGVDTAHVVDLFGDPISECSIDALPLRAWEIATVRLR